MSEKVVRFRSKRDLMKRETAAKLAAFIEQMSADELPTEMRAVVLNQMHRMTHPDDEETIWPGGYNMLSRDQTEWVWDRIDALPPSARPKQVDRAFKLVLLNLRQDTGEVMLTRDELAERIGTDADNVSRVMGTLEELGAIYRKRQPIPGMRGPGKAIYFINPHVGWNGRLDVRMQQAAKIAAPSGRLKVVQGGKAP